MTTTTPDDLRARIIRIVLSSAEGDLAEGDLAATGGYLPGVSYSSLSYLRMIDRIENEFGVYLDPEEENERFQTIDSLVELVSQQLGESAGA
jgi:acyl carrier protein